MRARKNFLVIIMLFVFLFTTSAFNAYATVSAWRYCEVNETGPSGGVMYVQLTDTASAPAWTGARYFVLPSAMDKQMLAVLLTAMSLGKTVRVQIPDGPTNNFAANSVIRTVFLAD